MIDVGRGKPNDTSAFARSTYGKSLVEGIRGFDGVIIFDPVLPHYAGGPAFAEYPALQSWIPNRLPYLKERAPVSVAED